MGSFGLSVTSNSERASCLAMAWRAHAVFGFNIVFFWRAMPKSQPYDSTHGSNPLDSCRRPVALRLVVIWRSPAAKPDMMTVETRKKERRGREEKPSTLCTCSGPLP